MVILTSTDEEAEAWRCKVTYLPEATWLLIDGDSVTPIFSKLKFKAFPKEIFSNMNIACERYLSYNQVPHDYCTSNFGHTRERCIERGPLLIFSTIYKRSLTCTLFLMAATLCSTFLCLSETEELCKDFSRGPWKNVWKFQHIKKIVLIWTIF